MAVVVQAHFGGLERPDKTLVFFGDFCFSWFLVQRVVRSKWMVDEDWRTSLFARLYELEFGSIMYCIYHDIMVFVGGLE